MHRYLVASLGFMPTAFALLTVSQVKSDPMASLVAGLPCAATAAIIYWMAFQSRDVMPLPKAVGASGRVVFWTLRSFCGVFGLLWLWMGAMYLLLPVLTLISVISAPQLEWLAMVFGALMEVVGLSFACIAFLFLRFAFTGRLKKRPTPHIPIGATAAF